MFSPGAVCSSADMVLAQPDVPWPRIRCITFDLDDCLWDSVQVMTCAEEARTSVLSERYPRVLERWPTWQSFRAEAMAHIARTQPDIAHSPSDVQKQALALCAEECGYPADELVTQAFGAFAAARRDATLFDDTVPLLTALRQRGLIIGTITNGNADAQAVPGLGSLVDFSITAKDAGAAKPSPRIFKRAVANLASLRPGDGEVDPRSIVHVGDDHDKDCAGARSAGLRSIWCPASQAWDLQGPVAVEVPEAGYLGQADARVSKLRYVLDAVVAWSETDARL